MAKDAAGGAGCYVAFADVEVCAADGGFGELDQGVGWGCEMGDGAVLEGDLVGICVD